MKGLVVLLGVVITLLLPLAFAAQPKIDASSQIDFSNGISMNGGKISGLADGTAPGDAMTIKQSWLKLNKTDTVESSLGQYTTIVYYSGNNIYAKWYNGTLIASGTKITNDATVAQAALNKGGKCVIKDLLTPDKPLWLNESIELIGAGFHAGFRGSANPLLKTSLNKDKKFSVRSIYFETTAGNTGFMINKTVAAGQPYTEFDVDSCTFRSWSGTGVMLDVVGTNTMHITNCLFNGTYDARTNTSQTAVGVYIHSPTSSIVTMNVGISDCIFLNTMCGIKIIGYTTYNAYTAGVRVDNSLFIGSGWGIYAERCDNIVLAGSMADNVACGLYFKDVDRFVVTGNFFSKGGGSRLVEEDSATIYVYATCYNLYHSVISSNYIENAATNSDSAVIKLRGSNGYQLRRTLINGNTITSSYKGVILMGDAANSVFETMILNNWISGTTCIHIADTTCVHTYLFNNCMQASVVPITNSGTATHTNNNWNGGSAC